MFPSSCNYVGARLPGAVFVYDAGTAKQGRGSTPCATRIESPVPRPVRGYTRPSHHAPQETGSIPVPMNTLWGRSRPFVWAIGGHVVVLVLLCLDWQQAPSWAAASRSDDAGSVSAVEATLVSVPLPAVAKPVAPQVAPTPLPAPQPTPIVPPPPAIPAAPVARPAPIAKVDVATQAAAPQAPPAAQSPASSESSRPQSDDDGKSTAEAPPPPADSDDPYAEMRRQRAEQERAHQVEEQQRRDALESEVRSLPQPPAPAAPPVSKQAIVPTLEDFAVDPFVAVDPASTDNPLAGPSGLPSITCSLDGPVHFFNGAVTNRWLNCLFDAAGERWQRQALPVAGAWPAEPASPFQ
jgi:hypothetical protein